MPARPDVVTVRPVQQTPGWTPSPRPANAQDNRTQNVRPSGPGPSMDRAPQRQDVVHAQPNAQPPPRAAPPAQVKPESAHPAAEAKPERDKGAGADQQH